MNLGRISGAAIITMLSFSVLVPGACAPGQSSQNNDATETESCRVPRVMFVVDASSSMLETLPGTTSMTKWQALSKAVHEVLSAHGNGAQYGLMTFPGSESGCSTGEVLVDIGLRTREKIDSEITRVVIPEDAATPAGQTLIEAATLESLTDRNYDNYVIFISDGWQYCAEPDANGGPPQCGMQGDCEWMGAENCETCNACQIEDTSADCYNASADGCYCVRNWPVLGVEALKAAGVKTYVVGFGDKVDSYTLNQAAVAGGNPLPNCNKNSETPSCFLQATSPSQLTDVLGKVMMRLTTSPCQASCGTKGTRTCTLEGWTKCTATCTSTSSKSASSSTGSSTSSTSTGTSTSSTSTSTSTTSTSTTSTSTSTSTTSTSSSSSSGYGGASGEGGSSGQGASSGEGAGYPSEEEDPWDDGGDDSDYEDVYEEDPPESTPAEGEAEAEGGCSYAPNAPASRSDFAGWALVALVAAGWRRRRTR